MLVKELIVLLQKQNQEKEVIYSSSSEGIQMSISGVTTEIDMWDFNKEEVVAIVE